MGGFLAAQTGDRKCALKAIKQIEEKWIGAASLNDIAFVYYALGDFDSYFTYVNRATDQHTVRYWYVMYCPLFAKATSDPRYEEFLNKIRKMVEAP